MKGSEIFYLGIEAGVTEAEEEAGGESQGLVWLDESNILCLFKRSILREVCQHQPGDIGCVFTNFDVKHSPSLPVGEETKDEAQEDNGMSAPLDCQEAKETKEKSTNNLSSCYQDGAYGS